MKRVAVYVRVSTASKSRQGDAVTFDQNPEVQERPLRDLIAQRGWVLHRVYSDRASGAKERRPGLDELMRDARRGVLDVVVVWRFDRFARSAKQLVLGLEEFRALGIDFISHQEAFDTSTPMGQAMFTIIAAMAQLERSLIGERARVGIAYAKFHGTKSGRPIGRPRAVFDRWRAKDLRAKGLSWGQIARRLGTSIASVRRACKQKTHDNNDGQVRCGTPDEGEEPCQKPAE
jgi:DNA invertase Pin-like site-specific DNA recombinase